ncbi:unnamed protein product, partial [Meganyctiphanes norvegica]
MFILIYSDAIRKTRKYDAYGAKPMSSPSVENVPMFGVQAERVRSVNEKFIKRFKGQPQFFARAPGRVNLIGEHIDYCGYAVFPMAVEQDIIIAVSTNSDGKLNLTNADGNYQDFTCDINSFEISSDAPSWYKYVMCGIIGIKDEGGLQKPLTGLDMSLIGTIPPSSGLSSSSALVCASALAVSHAHNLNLSKKELAEICARSERHIGTQGGGMDQAISFLATAGSANVIEFNPLRASPVTLPSGAQFVVANSLAPMNKAASSHYNCRVMECRLATQIMAKQNGLKWQEYRKFIDLQKSLGKSLPEMIELVRSTFHGGVYTKEEICGLLETTVDELDQITLSENTRNIQEFNLYGRAHHVFSEAHRVWEFKLVSESKTEKGRDVLSELGVLMKESHESCRVDYECSHPKLDSLVELSKDLAFGARLTGAGWGGCMVALVHEDKVDDYLAMLKKEYFSKEDAAKNREIHTYLFSTQPGSGACIYKS